MKNQLRNFLLVLVAALTFGPTRALADPVPFLDVISPNVLLSSSLTSYTIQHDIRDSFSPTFNPSSDSIQFATLTLLLVDDSLFDGLESVSFNLDGASFGSSTFNWISLPSFSVGIAALLQSDGLLDVTVTRTAGDFYFATSVLHGWAERQAGTIDSAIASVPEPSTLTLLGSGLIGLAGLAKRSRRKS